MNILKALAPTSFAASFAIGIIGNTNLASLILAVGICLIMSLLAFDTIINYIIPNNSNGEIEDYISSTDEYRKVS